MEGKGNAAAEQRPASRVPSRGPGSNSNKTLREIRALNDQCPEEMSEADP
ncbi:hypothetical protein Lesp02_02880 [Lentzea sp. NBRC 105346]|nr:hypothetical protein Lesp02_02880 [Lentzea sp. NBRC 105346]